MQNAFEKIISKLEEMKKKTMELRGKPHMDYGTLSGWYCACDELIKWIKKFVEEYDCGWIPLTADSVPDEGQVVDITFRNSAGIHVGEATYKKEKFFYVTDTVFGYYEEQYENVLAWKPRPKPYTSTNQLSLTEMLRQSVFDDICISDEYDTTTMYFKAPKEILKALLGEEYSDEDAVSAEISIEMPTAHLESRYADIAVSPTVCEKCDGAVSYVDTDWNDVELPHDEVDNLLSLGLQHICMWKCNNLYNKTSCGEKIKYIGADWKHCPFCGKAIIQSYVPD